MDHYKLRMFEKSLMKQCSAQLLLPLFVMVSLLSYLPVACTDLNSDRQALQAFAAAVTQGSKLEWDNATSICTSWVGITCTSDGARVLTVRLPAFGLTGPIPSNTLGELDALRVLNLRSNSLNGSLPSDLLFLTSLRSLFLQHNNFTGNIPHFLPHRLQILDLSHNSFTGEIPTTLNLVTRLTGLFLQNNSLTGPIPNVTLPNLKHFNISNNHLNGSIPSSFKAFPISSFLGNSLVCGLPLEPCLTFSFSTIEAIAITSAVGVLTLIVIFAFHLSSYPTRKPSSVLAPDNNEVEVVYFRDTPFYFTRVDLCHSFEVLGKGSFGIAYKAVMEESVTMVVKWLEGVTALKKDFEQQMKITEKVGHHHNVVPLRGYFFSRYQKFVVYEYFSKGSLMSLLHGNSGAAGRILLDWETRIKIALGTARGIAHIHSFGDPKLIHGNIKSSNVLISRKTEGVISDMGLVSLMDIPCAIGTAGYRAPEIVKTRKHSHKSDVYSFGVVLLEMLTGKQPIQSPVREKMVDLPKWVQSVVRENWTAEVFDIQLMRFHNIEEEMMQMLQIALACIVRSPDSRPTIHEVVKMLEQIQFTQLYKPTTE